MDMDMFALNLKHWKTKLHFLKIKTRHIQHSLALAGQSRIRNMTLTLRPDAI